MNNNNIVSKDTCTCSCYANGLVVLILVQVLLFCATLFSGFAMIDCRFVQVDAKSVDPELSDIFHDLVLNTTVLRPNNDTKRRLGFYFYEGVDGKCVFEHYEDIPYHHNATDWGENFGNNFEAYMELLGNDWDTPRGLGTAAAGLAWLFWIWTMIMGCVAHIKVLRWILGALIVAILATFQSATYSVLHSDFCDTHGGCEIDRSSRFGIAAVIFFAAAGVLLFFTKDFSHNPLGPVAADAVAIKDVENASCAYEKNGDANITEVPVESEMVDVALVDDSAAETLPTSNVPQSNSRAAAVPEYSPPERPDLTLKQQVLMHQANHSIK
jgi:hypothetical protein